MVKGEQGQSEPLLGGLFIALYANNAPLTLMPSGAPCRLTWCPFMYRILSIVVPAEEEVLVHCNDGMFSGFVEIT